MCYNCATERGGIMAKTASLHMRIDPEIKADAEAIFAEYGLSITEAVNIFLYKSRSIQGLPFDLRPEPNATTLAAMREGDAIIASGKGRFDNVDDMFKELDA